MSYVWENSKLGGTELLCLLAIADFCDDQGVAYPSVATLASKIRMSERNTHYLLSKVADSGELKIERNAGPKGCNLFRVQSLQGVQPIAGGGATGSAKGVQPIAPEPSLNRQRTVNKGSTRFVPPSWVPSELWDAYLEMRRKIKKPLVTKRGLAMAVSKLESLKESGNDPAAVLENAIFNSYQGLFPVKGKSNASSLPGERL